MKTIKKIFILTICFLMVNQSLTIVQASDDEMMKYCEILPNELSVSKSLPETEYYLHEIKNNGIVKLVLRKVGGYPSIGTTFGNTTDYAINGGSYNQYTDEHIQRYNSGNVSYIGQWYTGGGDYDPNTIYYREYQVEDIENLYYDVLSWNEPSNCVLLSTTENSPYTEVKTSQNINDIMKVFSMKQVKVIFRVDVPEDKIIDEYYIDINTAPIEPLLPTYEGYTFVGWNIDPSQSIATATTYIAEYNMNTYTVTFNNSDGTLINSFEVKHGDDATAPTDINIPEGYTFVGWDKPFTNITEDTVITAMIEKEPVYVNVTFTSNDEDLGGFIIDNQLIYHFNVNNVTTGTAISAIMPTTHGKDNSKVSGYFVNGTKIDIDTYKIIETVNIEVRFFSDVNDNDIDDQTEQVTINFNTVGGTEVNPVVITLNTRLENVPKTTKDGYVLVGWYTTANYTNQWFFTDKVIEDMVLYAKWETKKETHATVSFESLGGSFIPDVVVELGGRLKEPIKPLKDGYTFIGWFTSPNGGSQWYFSQKVEKNMILYAKWTSNTTTTTPVPTTPPSTITVPSTDTEECIDYITINPLIGQKIVITFKNVEGEFIREENLVYGQTIYILDKDSNRLKEYAVRQSTSIILDEPKEINGYSFDSWFGYYDENRFVLQQKYEQYEVKIVDELTETEKVEVIEKSQKKSIDFIQIGLILIALVGIFVLLIYLMKFKKEKTK